MCDGDPMFNTLEVFSITLSRVVASGRTVVIVNSTLVLILSIVRVRFNSVVTVR